MSRDGIGPIAGRDPLSSHRDRASVRLISALLSVVTFRARISFLAASTNQKGFWIDYYSNDEVYIGCGPGIIAIEGHNPK